MRKTNEFLRKKAKWYQDWDDHKYSYHFHWMFLAIFVVGVVFGLIIQLWILPPEFSGASTPTEVGLDDNRYGSQCYGGTGDYYTDIPSSYSGSRVLIEAAGTTNPSSCADLSVDLCDGDSSCTEDVVPGQRLNFQVSWYCGYCGDYESEDWTVSVSSVAGPVCGNGVCDTGETCTSCASDCLSTAQVCCSGTVYTGDCCAASDCSTGEVCEDHQCAEEDSCGDGTCDHANGEDCSNCSADCGCHSSACCDPDALSYTTSYGCALDGGETSSGYICCSGTDYAGDCCDDDDCYSGYICTSHQCATESVVTPRPTSLTFGTSGGTQDGGTVTYSDGAYTWTVTLPSNYTKVETALYDPNNPSTIKKYMGWNGWEKVNGDYVWKFLSWSAGTGGVIQDYTLGQQVYESTGSGLWLDVTDFVNSGSNTITYYHYTEGDGIALKVRVTTGTEAPAVTSSYCGDGTCDTGETCTSCASDCLLTTQVCCSGTAYTGDCCSSSDCSTGYECTSHACTSIGSYCGDGTCDWPDEHCSNCATDCSACTSGNATSSMTFTTSGGTEDGGYLSYLDGAHTWTVTLPDNFTKVETTQYDRHTSTTYKKYMGWNGYLKVNSEYLWKFLSWSASTGGLIQDYALGQQVYESTGAGLWIDATDFFNAGSNTVTYYHYTEGDGLGLKIKVTTADAVVEESSCGDGTCDTGETCTSCAADCLSSTQVCCSGTAYTGDCCIATDCSTGETCTSHSCVASTSSCGDGTCETGEDCSTCASDCYCYSTECCAPSASSADSYGCVDTGETTTSNKICCSGTDYIGTCCLDSDCTSSQACTDHACVASGPSCGDGTCDTGETCTSCASDCLLTTQVCCLGTAYTGGCCTTNDCGAGFECSSHACVASSYCGDGTCDTGETCTSCASDCLSSGQICCSGTAYIGDCCTASDCSSKQECSNHACVASSYCGDGTCDSDESCKTCDDDCGDCVADTIEPKDKKPKKEKLFKISSATQKLIDEYKTLHARLIALNKKIVVAELDSEKFSPFDMHTSMEAEIDDLTKDGTTEMKLQSMLKHAIAAENLALATYEGEAEMATMLAESSWQAFKAYLLYKVEAVVAGQLERVDLESALELAGSMKESYENSEDPEEYLKELGLENISEINEAIHKAVNSAGGRVTQYMTNIENGVKKIYIDGYVDMFNDNFKEAISRQLVYYQVAVKYWITEKGEVPKAEVPYGEYRSAMAAIQNEIKEEKQFLAGDNVFARLVSLNNKFKEGADEVDKILEEIGAAAEAVDKGASWAGKQANFSEAVDSLKEYNAGLKSAINLAGESLGLVGTFAESAYGTYKEAELYSIFFNTYDKWYDACLGGAVTVLEVPLTDKKIDITTVYRGFAPLVGVADRAITKAGQAASALVDGASNVAGAGVEMIKTVGNKLSTTIKKGKKVTQKIIVSGAKAAGKAKKAAKDVVKGTKKKAGELIDYGKSLVYSVDFSSVWGYAPEDELQAIKSAHAVGKPMIEVALLSPSDVRFAGREREDGTGIDVIVNNPEPGEWTAEIIGKEIEGELPLEITTTMEDEELEEFKTVEIKEEVKVQEKEASWLQKYWWWILIIAVVVVAALITAFSLKRKRKA